VTVAKATPKMTLTGSSSSHGAGPVTYSVVVTGAAGLVPRGSVTVGDGAGRTCTIAALSVSGGGSCTITEPLGTYTVTASYAGDAAYLGVVKVLKKKVS
jgi:hypothetical protein